MSTTPRTSRRPARILVPLAAALALTTATACGAEDDETGRAATTTPNTHPAPLTCGGAGIDGDARIRYRTETLIDAPLRTIWELQTDVERWPSWQQPVTSMKLLDQGPLREGSRFQWTTPAPATATTPATTLVITSSVHQLQPDTCVRWSGPGIGDGLRIDNGVHVWTFTEVDGGVLVRTEENWTGAQVEADVPTSTAFLGAGLEAWLRDLKAAAEAAS
ncbi:Polyketide cyclase / dehydrase and lipid transport [Nocardia amikacinitolerans]|uniref:Polyketide cyclase / dehydrase and lipid transport n=1 Tax=Nocardia amikacinitolerans TaxID=756689 RepID=A0A285KX68_9NOCA|nr:SRPBCC family protein [Nocardia amikacinitolerans]MCP2275893.1 Polyketide cyclase / dehydrase and lipid transport [Nocardia amikacinitolerans]MCP2294164.1 Polyketide cyclase / dehydrase and lipid transport [Nocardia amikacinitolerans]SNY76427.1 Polyketide cyclase / dehydrase and lipid transport [Nocardia amikacinitolerans]